MMCNSTPLPFKIFEGRHFQIKLLNSKQNRSVFAFLNPQKLLGLFHFRLATLYIQVLKVIIQSTYKKQVLIEYRISHNSDIRLRPDACTLSKYVYQTNHIMCFEENKVLTTGLQSKLTSEGEYQKELLKPITGQERFEAN